MNTSNRKTFTNFSVEQLEGRWMKDLHQRGVTEVKLEEGYQLAYLSYVIHIWLEQGRPS